jgi:hypothetical protein
MVPCLLFLRLQCKWIHVPILFSVRLPPKLRTHSPPTRARQLGAIVRTRREHCILSETKFLTMLPSTTQGIVSLACPSSYVGTSSTLYIPTRPRFPLRVFNRLMYPRLRPRRVKEGLFASDAFTAHDVHPDGEIVIYHQLSRHGQEIIIIVVCVFLP